MANNKDIKKDKPKKGKKKRKPIYEIQGFVLTIPEESSHWTKNGYREYR